MENLVFGAWKVEAEIEVRNKVVRGVIWVSQREKELCSLLMRRMC